MVGLGVGGRAGRMRRRHAIPPLAVITSATPDTVSASALETIILGGELDVLAGSTALAISGEHQVAVVEDDVGGDGWYVDVDGHIVIGSGAAGAIASLIAVAGATPPFTFIMRFTKNGQSVDSPGISVTA